MSERIPTKQGTRLTDRVSFLYLEHAKVVQWESGVVALQEERSSYVRVPIGILAVIALGPGTSITQPAAQQLADAGATLMFTGGGGYPVYSTAKPLTSSSQWAEAQARCWAGESSRLQAARTLYEARFGAVLGENARSLASLRGLEGRLVREEYQRLRRKYRISFKRDHTSADPVNASLNVGNALLYGVANAVCSALALNPSLGVIHQGNAKAFLFDLADVYKTTITIPTAFAASREADPIAFTRRRVRTLVEDGETLRRMLELVQQLFSPHLSSSSGSEGLYDGDGRMVPGHRNHGE